MLYMVKVYDSNSSPRNERAVILLIKAPSVPLAERVAVMEGNLLLKAEHTRLGEKYHVPKAEVEYVDRIDEDDSTRSTRLWYAIEWN